MTEQEAIEIIKYASAFNSDNSPLTKALDVAMKALEKQAEYKTLEEQGKLLELPCKVGDKAYYVHREYSDKTKRWFNKIDEVEVDSFVLNVNLFVNVSMYIGGDRFGKTLTPYKTLFFTQEKAEAALERMKGEEHEQNRT